MAVHGTPGFFVSCLNRCVHAAAAATLRGIACIYARSAAIPTPPRRRRLCAGRDFLFSLRHRFLPIGSQISPVSFVFTRYTRRVYMYIYSILYYTRRLFCRSVETDFEHHRGFKTVENPTSQYRNPVHNIKDFENVLPCTVFHFYTTIIFRYVYRVIYVQPACVL